MDAKIDQLANSIRPLIGQPVRVLPPTAKPQAKRHNFGLIGGVAALVLAAVGVGMFISRPAASSVAAPAAVRDNPVPDVAKLRPAPAPIVAHPVAVPVAVPDAAPRSAPQATVAPVAAHGEASPTVPAPLTTATTASRFAGTWTGQYVCAQGATGLRLVLSEMPGERVRGEFQFYPLPGRTAPSGSFQVAGAVEGLTMTLKAGQWISRPAGYDGVDLVARLQDGNPTRLAGHVLYAGCDALSVQRTSK
jgi:hypothetical protein